MNEGVAQKLGVGGKGRFIFQSKVDVLFAQEKLTAPCLLYWSSEFPSEMAEKREGECCVAHHAKCEKISSKQ